MVHSSTTRFGRQCTKITNAIVRQIPSLKSKMDQPLNSYCSFTGPRGHQYRTWIQAWTLMQTEYLSHPSIIFYKSLVPYPSVSESLIGTMFSPRKPLRHDEPWRCLLQTYLRNVLSPACTSLGLPLGDRPKEGAWRTEPEETTSVCASEASESNALAIVSSPRVFDLDIWDFRTMVRNCKLCRSNYPSGNLIHLLQTLTAHRIVSSLNMISISWTFPATASPA